MMWWQAAMGIVGGLAVLWGCLVGFLWWARPDHFHVTEALRLAPDLLRLLRRLAADPALPFGVRVRLALLLAYLLCPVDLIPDFVPIVGYADDAIIVVLALRSVVRRAGPEAVDRHWPGTPEGLAAIHRLAGLDRPGSPTSLAGPTGPTPTGDPHR